MSENIVHVSQTSFDEDVLNADRPVLVDYWAEWCGPCKMIAPILDEIAQEYGDRVKVCKVNVDENQAAAERYGI
jgi:thioredoxin 1